MADSGKRPSPTRELDAAPPAPRSLPERLRGFLARRRFLSLSVLVAALVVAGFWMMSRPPVVQTLTVQPRTVEIALSVVGRVRPLDLVDVRSPNAGQVTHVFADEGDVVAEGFTLATILASVEQAQADASLARERAAQADAERARLAYSRAQTLADRGFASAAALDDARATLRSAEGALAAASAERRASISRTRELTIRAPMAGTVLVRPIDNGQVVSPESTLFQIGSTSGVEIQAEVDEAYADALRPGMEARAALSGSDEQFAARITEVSPRVDPATGGRLVKLSPPSGLNMPPGRSVDVTIVIERRSNTIAAPREAIVDAAGAPTVYVVDAGGAVVARRVQVFDWPSLNAIVERGLSAGDRLVLTPGETKPGAHVRIDERPAPARAQEG